ncbi:MAG: CinA family nicotinamide mononucleotide deamidase-related protein [Candidatus Bipolaricaulota bacterium]
MDVQVVTVGSELLLGQIVDTNSAYIARQLAQIGANVFHIRTVGDNQGRLTEVLREARRDSDVVITTGGLGPTSDDITVECIARTFEKNLELRDEALKHLEKISSRIGKDVTSAGKTQAYFPEDSTTIPNPRGSALGLILETPEGTVIAMPGVSGEMKAMMSDHVTPWLKEKMPEDEAGQVIQSKVLRLCGIGESTLQDRVADFLEMENPTVAPLAKLGEVHLRISARGNAEKVEEMIEEVENQLRERLGKLIYATDSTPLHERVAEMLTNRQLSFSVLEICTGGSTVHCFSRAVSSRTYLREGLIVFSPSSLKRVLALNLEEFSDPTEFVRTSASRLRLKAETDLALSTFNPSGISGPLNDGTEGKFFLALASTGRTTVQEYRPPTAREKIDRRTAKEALTLLYNKLVEPDFS